MNTTKQGRLPLLRPGNWVFTRWGGMGRITHRTTVTNTNGMRAVTYAVRVKGKRQWLQESDVRLTTQATIDWGSKE